MPYLFVGAGFSIRYAGADGWSDLLRRFAEPLGRPFEYYLSTANGDLPTVASLLSHDFHEVWWTDERFAESRRLHQNEATHQDSALKIEISRHLSAAASLLPTDGPLASELELLRSATIDGIITTNFDPALEALRPDLEAYVGQDELLFSDPQGIGEIYKIHGSTSQPNSLILTAEDYASFEARNAYLVAKLLTIFVEHPVVFLGYSLSDRNIQRILVDIARCLTDDRIDALRDRLLFVDWKPNAIPSMTSTVVSAEGFTIPVHNITVPNYAEVFASLNTVRRQLPARLIRHLRKEVYELVKTNETSERVYVEELSSEDQISDVEVYAGIGAVTKITASYVGLDRKDLLLDVLTDRHYDARRVVSEALPQMGAVTTHVPVYKYLGAAGLLTPSGDLKTPEQQPVSLAKRVAGRKRRLKGLAQYEKRAARALSLYPTLADAANALPADDILHYIPFWPISFLDLNAFRDLLDREDTKGAFLAEHQPTASQWAKCVCLYDWLRYGRAPER